MMCISVGCSQFTLLFEQAAMILVREMPVLTTATIIEMTDKRLWRIVAHYVKTAMNTIDLSTLKAFSLDETKARKEHRYVTVFIEPQPASASAAGSEKSL